MMNPERRQTPLWFIVLLIVMALPLAAWPSLMSVQTDTDNDTVSTLIMIFPIYAVLSLYLAYRSYGRRSDLSWVLLAVSLLSYAAVAALVF